ncbi:Aste57867_16415 [Aphanomyces stellatus]|uniref:Aste57867_16415 protein n=1 Tax=Aphanomyces stellatus TaxID=120398 RepID=A0A485L678_9STRA|nr:hypothetical protein As57867_016358 [Aphanomyces stellatus]VFT93190.1 Aste57867_16415 [Aphanomyces stellatus]
MSTSTNKDKEYFKAWYTRNKEKVIARVKEYNATHREAQNARMQQWREKNRDKIAAYREIHREQRRQYKRDHYRRTKEKRRAAVTDEAAPAPVKETTRMSMDFLLSPAAEPVYVAPTTVVHTAEYTSYSRMHIYL